MEKLAIYGIHWEISQLAIRWEIENVEFSYVGHGYLFGLAVPLAMVPNSKLVVGGFFLFTFRSHRIV